MIYPIITAEEAAEFVKNGDNVGVSGFTAPGCPKAVAPCIAAKAETEKAKVSVRNARREMIEGLKKAVKNGLPEDAQKDGEEKVQKLHDKFLKKIDEVFAAKEKEILTV